MIQVMFLKMLGGVVVRAIEKAEQWGDSTVIPILKIGLRDSDSRVVIKAAKAISKFRNHPTIISKSKVAITHPLNVFLMR